MNYAQQFLEALTSLGSNKLRSGLTILGIVIGVAAVVAMMAIGRGAQESINASIQSMGTNLLYINRGAQNIRNPKALTLEDAEAMLDSGSVSLVAPQLQARMDVAVGANTINTQVIGTTPAYGTLRSFTMSEGDFISDASVNGKSAVVVLGSEVANTLFGRTDNLVGQSLRLSGQTFRIIGVMAPKGGSGFGSSDNNVIIPITTAQQRLIRRDPRNSVDTISVQATSSDTITSAISEVSVILRNRHRTKEGSDDFTIMNQQDMLASASSMTGTLTMFLGGVAGISLLVGGIGIMNIMFVTVTERTREIGLRKALGARKIDIMLQFLTESAILSLIGGILGIILAVGIAQVVKMVAAASNTTLNPIVGLDAVLMSTLFSAAIGIFFGLYPSSRAANLEPVEALRTE